MGPQYIHSWEGHHTAELTGKYPLQLISPHPALQLPHHGRRQGQLDERGQGPPGAQDDGHYYWIMRINTKDADGPRHRGRRPHPGVQRPRLGDPGRAGHRTGGRRAWCTPTNRAPTTMPLGEPGESPDSRRLREHPHAQALHHPDLVRHGEQLLPHPDREVGGRWTRRWPDGKKWNMVIDVARCNDCNNCFLADKDEFVGNDWPPYSVAQPWDGHRWLNIQRKERGQFPQVQVAYLPTPCHALRRRSLHQGLAGRRRLQAGRRPGDHRPGEGQGPPEIVDDLPLRRHLLERRSAAWPRSAPAAPICWTRAGPRPAAPRSAPPRPSSWSWPTTRRWRRWSQTEGLEVYQPELGTAPRVYYKNLHRWTKAFVAGSAVFGDTGECAEGASHRDQGRRPWPARPSPTTTATSWWTGWTAGAEYVVAVKAAGYKPVEHKAVPTAGSLTLPAVALEKA